MKLSRNHKAALAWAARGIPVIPLLEGDKRPASEHAYKDATTDVDTINAWWTINPNYNIGGVPVAAGMCVVDVDRVGALDELEARHGALPPGYRVRTPKGGLHIWLKGSLPKTVSRIAEKVDTFGPGGYLVLPPSHTEPGEKTVLGDYKVESGTWPPTDEVPATWCDPKIYGDTGLSSKDLVAPDVQMDLPANIQRGRDMAARWPLVEHGTIDDTTYLHCAQLSDLGLSVPIIMDVIEDWYLRTGGNPDRLEEVAYSGTKNRQNQVGVHAVEDPAVQFGELASTLEIIPPGQQTEERSRFQVLDEFEQEALPDPTWLIQDVLPAKSTIMLYAPSGHWKTFLALDWALTIAMGHAKWGAVEQGGVAYIAAEGAHGLGKYRRNAWKTLHNAFDPLPFFVVDKMPWISRLDDVLELCDRIEAKMGCKPKLLVVDTLARAMMGLEENSAKDAGIAIEAIEIMKRRLDCSILALHHTRKDGEGYRGSGAILAGFDSVISLVANRENMTAEVWVKKHKDAEAREYPWRIKANKICDSLAFSMATAEDLAPGDRLKPADVGAVLRGLGVTEEDDAVVTAVLVEEIARFKLWDLRRAQREFRSLEKAGMVDGYSVKKGGPYFCPTSDPDEAEEAFG